MSSSGSFKSKSIPIDSTNYSNSYYNPFGRTLSEDQLCLDEALADTRDYQFCCRVVQGISKSIEDMMSANSASSSEKIQKYQHESRVCLDHIIRTRNDTDPTSTAAPTAPTATYIPTSSSSSPQPSVSARGARSSSSDDEWSPGLYHVEDYGEEDGGYFFGSTPRMTTDPLLASIEWLTKPGSTSSAARPAATRAVSQPATSSPAAVVVSPMMTMMMMNDDANDRYTTSSSYDDIMFDMDI